jgi:hypothetical protein
MIFSFDFKIYDLVAYAYTYTYRFIIKVKQNFDVKYMKCVKM